LKFASLLAIEGYLCYLLEYSKNKLSTPVQQLPENGIIVSFFYRNPRVHIVPLKGLPKTDRACEIKNPTSNVTCTMYIRFLEYYKHDSCHQLQFRLFKHYSIAS